MTLQAQPGSALPTRQPASASARLNFWQLQLLGWGALFVALVGSRLDHRPLLEMIGRRASYVVLGAGLSLVLHRALRVRVRRGAGMRELAVTTFVASGLLAMVWAASDSVLRDPALLFQSSPLSPPRRINALLLGTMNNAVILIAWCFLYIGTARSHALQAERERAMRAEALQATTRLHALQYQLNPHLLFNALNSLSTLVLERRFDDAHTGIVRLSEFLRATLRQPPANTVHLADELSLVGRYLDIEQVRFGAQLNVTYNIDEDAYCAVVPVLLLQPLVENAILHGATEATGQRMIAIGASVEAGRLSVVVENSVGPMVALPWASQGGVGLANVRERLLLIHGERATVRAGRSDSGSFRVAITMPFVKTDALVPPPIDSGASAPG
ncbi:MAG: histidine kinase [Gemmatimonadetes bacterium]|nr:histidine kinase [Gemmatimonadota bacterium]